LPQSLRQGADTFNINNPLAIDGLGHLPAPPPRFAQRSHRLSQLSNIHAKKTSQASTKPVLGV
jgi:hypothetical protein